MDQDWRKVIEQYDADVADGKISFGSGEFADAYPHKGEQDANLDGFLAEHAPPA